MWHITVTITAAAVAAAALAAPMKQKIQTKKKRILQIHDGKIGIEHFKSKTANEHCKLWPNETTNIAINWGAHKKLLMLLMVSVSIVYIISLKLSICSPGAHRIRLAWFFLCWFLFISLFARGSVFARWAFFLSSHFARRIAKCMDVLVRLLFPNKNLIPKYNPYMYLAEPKNKFYAPWIVLALIKTIQLTEWVKIAC